MDKDTGKIRLQEWVAIINEYNASGMTKIAWCKANGIKLRQFYYWQLKLRKLAAESIGDNPQPLSLPEKAGFYEITPSPTSSFPTPCTSSNSDSVVLDTPAGSSGISLEYGGYRMSLENHFSEETLASLLKVLRHA